MCFRPAEISANDKPCICPACGNENAPGEPKCIFCGADLSTDDVPAPGAPAASPAPGAPTSPSVPGAPKAR